MPKNERKSEYELLRQRNIRERNAMFKDILKAKKKVNKVFKKKISAATKKNGPNLDSVFNEKKDDAWKPNILKAKKKVKRVSKKKISAYRESNKETNNRYYLKGKRNGKVKGLLSKQLREDLFENHPDVLLAISVCGVCYRVFKTKEELGVHKTADHANVKERNRDCYIDDNKYKCPKCDEIKKVGHVVWFAKHLRYCGKDKKKANAILGPDDVDVKE